MKYRYLLSIIVLTYNHEKYVKQALDSILMQKVSFDYEILIGDDASTDLTRSILQAYKESYPDKIKLFLREKNMGASRNMYELLVNAQGKYIANLEGDDFWVSDHKLQKQVDFLENHNEYIACFHQCLYVDEHGDKIPSIRINGDYSLKQSFCLKDLEQELPGQTATNLYRNIYMDHPEYDYTCIYRMDSMNSDKTIWLILLNLGNIYIMPEVMSYYRYIISENSINASSLYQGKIDSLFIYIRKLEKLSKSMFCTDIHFVQKKRSYLFQALYNFIHCRTLASYKCLKNIILYSDTPILYTFISIKYLIFKAISFICRPIKRMCMKIRSIVFKPVFQQLHANKCAINELHEKINDLQNLTETTLNQFNVFTDIYATEQNLIKSINTYVSSMEGTMNSYRLPVMRSSPIKQGDIQFGAEALFKLTRDYNFTTVLDIGCGDGKHSEYFISLGKKVTSIDIGDSVYFKHNTVLHNVIIDDFNAASFDTQFDCVWCSHVLEHQLNVHNFLKKIHSLLKENGVLAITVPPAKAQIVGGHVSIWNAGLLLYNLVLAGFDCKDAAVKEYDYNISVIVVKKSIDIISTLSFDIGDICTIKKYLPTTLEFFNTGIDTPFNGDIRELNWR